MKLNRSMIGWANYFCLGPVSKAYRAMERMPASGCVSGCAPNTKYHGRRRGGFRKPACTAVWVCPAYTAESSFS